jgi:hypothetical protein
MNHNLTLAQAAMDGANGINADGRYIRVSFASENPQGTGAALRVLRSRVVCVYASDFV